MDRVVRIDTLAGRTGRTAYGWAISQPSWIIRLAALTFLLVVAVPILFLVALALLLGAIVFGGLALLHAAVGRLRRIGRRDRRANVRVIRRPSRAR